jgi:hypothetical protein
VEWFMWYSVCLARPWIQIPVPPKIKKKKTLKLNIIHKALWKTVSHLNISHCASPMTSSFTNTL